jgi:hypothetical protein
MQITITIPDQNDSLNVAAITDALETIAEKATISNIQFLAEIASKPKINEKLEKKKGMIRRNL